MDLDLARAILVLIVGLLYRGWTAPTTTPTSPALSDQRIRIAGRPQALLAVALLFFVFAYSEELLDAAAELAKLELDPYAVWLLAVDGLLLVGVGLVGRRVRRNRAASFRSHGVLWWSLGSVLLLAVDVARLELLTEKSGVLAEMFLLLAYLPGFAVLVGFLLDASIVRIARAAWSGDITARERGAEVLTTVPLLVGTGAAFVGGLLYGTELRSQVHQEYFAQLSQVIALLLVALVLETHAIRVSRDDRPLAWAVTIYTGLMLVVGEALALSTLPVENVPADRPGDREVLLYDWHEYAAFVATLFASFLALTSLLPLLATPRTAPGDGRQDS